MHPHVEQQLAYVLLTELLAHQFASPVRWIETQDVLLGHQNVERVIEIGPSDTLVAMAKKTLDSRYKTHDSARLMRRKLMYYKRDAKEIQYDADALAPPSEATNGSFGTTQPTKKKRSIKVAEVKNVTVEPVATVVSTPPPSQEVAQGVLANGNVPDAPVGAKDITVAIIAQKLKKAYNDIEMNKTVKQLVGGRSTLENEIVGDLGAEFGSTPERAEEMELEELCQSLQASPSFSSQLGKTSNGMIARLFSLKMPGGFGMATVRNYLSSRWGLTTARQDAVFLRACTVQPSARLATVLDAQTFFDGVVKRYAEINGIDLSSSSSSSDCTAVAATVAVDGKALAAVTKDRDQLRSAKLELYAKHLGVDLRAGERATVKAQKIIEELQGQLDVLSAELGDVFSSGIRPVWAAPKIRRFDSNWNWVLQDTLELFHSILLGRSDMTTNNIPNSSIRIANRANPRLLRVMRYLMENPSPEWGNRFQAAKGILSHLVRTCEATPVPSFKPIASYTDAFITAPSTTMDKRGRIQYGEIPRFAIEAVPNIHIKTKDRDGWVQNKEVTGMYLDLLEDARQYGLSFTDKNVLLTGASPDSIGAEILRGLLSGGARVIVTTSSYSFSVTRYYQELYVHHGSRGSQLIVAPFNQGSQQDLEALVSYIYDPVNGLGWDLDHVIPFAAIPESGREIDNLDSKSELAHRIMLTNTLRLLGAIKRQKLSRGFDTRPTQVILPLSPNHGAFGNDGLYGESKIALETLFERWHSESWSAYLSICGVVIGWTRGTGLMAGNNIVASGIEKMGVRTFSQAEMAFYSLALMSRPIAIQTDIQPLYADLTGGLNSVSNLKAVLDGLRREITETSEVLDAVAKEESVEKAVSSGRQQAPEKVSHVLPRANIRFDFPKLPNYEAELQPLNSQLKGMVDLDRVVVVTGFSEVGPWGNARTRWEMEATGQFSLEGCCEMAWIMGLIKNHNGPLEGKHYTGWVDAKTLKPVHDADVKAKYEKEILEHSGIRLVEPELDDGFDPQKKQVLQEIILEEDLPPFSAPKEQADQFALEHGDKVDVFEAPGGEDFTVHLKKGATLIIPKALRFDRTVAGQIPTGWNPRTYGIPEDTISQVDRVTLFALISTVEALLGAGITDPYELYKYVHVSEIGNCIGSGLGGAASLKKIYKSRYLDKSVQNDILQESFINTTSAWINMLILSSSGPIRTSVGACATSIESLETGFETIVSGKAKLCLVGGFDDWSGDIAAEFANMKATSNSDEEFSKGRIPQDMSRPTSESRSGFMESQGSGIQVLTSARLALDMGLPIHGIIAWAGTSSDKIGRSIPAPGRGILTNARETTSAFPSPLLDIEYRRRRLQLRKKQIKEGLDMELKMIQDELMMLPHTNRSVELSERIRYRMHYVKLEAERQEKEALNIFGNEFWKNDSQISPIRGALAVWGLTIDDLDFASFHGTSTKMNDKNETEVMQAQLSHLGRKQGNPIFGIFQKYLTGHSKGAAGAWMLNGCLQVLDSGLVPGNRNADNIDPKLENSDLIVYPNRSIQTAGMKAFSVTSFGFGQKGAQAIGVHPKYLLATLDRDEYRVYESKVRARQRKAFQFFHNALATNTMFVAKDTAPYRDDQETTVLLNPDARVSESGSGSNLYAYDFSEAASSSFMEWSSHGGGSIFGLQ